ncbi:regulator of g protein signaling [Anaeramoeba flamelloides]|uniref:Regulator of g protein signaling n=1 Tax=Anaeramoeba flamelloides TaxID=1746091 RepID=A0ABQ8Y7A7_9EUKA|nr:regulator of g protein signaling [Anaeramoeba flamelloides]
MTSFSNLNTTSAGIDHNITLYETDDDLDTSNLDTEIKEVERKFFQKKSRISEKFMFKAITIQFIFYHFLYVFLYYGSEFHTRKVCTTRKLNWNTVILFASIYINVLILFIAILLIRKIKENYKFRNEIFFSLIVIVLYIFFLYLPVISESVNYHVRWLAIFYSFFQFLISFAYPIYWSKSFESNKKKINNNFVNENGSGVSDHGHSNGSDDDYKIKKNYQKFIRIIDCPERVNYWIKYSQKNYSVENIFFYRTVKAFSRFVLKNKKNKKNNKKKLQMMKQLFQNFILERSSLGINISSEVRKELLLEYEKITQIKEIREYTFCEDLFNDALEEIMSLMFSDTWPQFYTSSFYLNMVLEIKQINPDQYLTKNEEDEDEAEDNNNHNNEEDDIKMISLNKISDDTQSQSSISLSQENTSSDSDNRIESEKEY